MIVYFGCKMVDQAPSVVRPSSSADDSENGFFLAARRWSSSWRVPRGQKGSTSSASLVTLCTMSALPSIFTQAIHESSLMQKGHPLMTFASVLGGREGSSVDVKVDVAFLKA